MCRGMIYFKFSEKDNITSYDRPLGCLIICTDIYSQCYFVPPTVLQYKLSYTIWKDIEVYDEPVPWTKKITHYIVKFEADEEYRIVCESL